MGGLPMPKTLSNQAILDKAAADKAAADKAAADKAAAADKVAAAAKAKAVSELKSTSTATTALLEDVKTAPDTISGIAAAESANKLKEKAENISKIAINTIESPYDAITFIAGIASDTSKSASETSDVAKTITSTANAAINIDPAKSDASIKAAAVAAEAKMYADASTKEMNTKKTALDKLTETVKKSYQVMDQQRTINNSKENDEYIKAKAKADAAVKTQEEKQTIADLSALDGGLGYKYVKLMYNNLLDAKKAVNSAYTNETKASAQYKVDVATEALASAFKDVKNAIANATSVSANKASINAKLANDAALNAKQAAIYRPTTSPPTTSPPTTSPPTTSPPTTSPTPYDVTTITYSPTTSPTPYDMTTMTYAPTTSPTPYDMTTMTYAPTTSPTPYDMTTMTYAPTMQPNL